jgi:DNA-binding transcriptional LysR family regulator
MELERLLGARLLDRTTRRVAPTEAGRAYYERALAILASVEETELQISRLHDEPKGVLRVNAPMSFGTLYLGPAVARFMARYDDLAIELTLSDRFIDPLEEGVDVTVRIGILADSSLIARRLAPARRVLVASPDYITRTGTPTSVADLARHHCLTYGHMAPAHRWQLSEGGKPVTIEVRSALCSNNGEVLRDAALAGRGITLLPTFIVGPDIAAGRLAVVLGDSAPPELAIHALYAPNRYLAAKTRLFIDFIAESFGDAPEWDAFANMSRERRPTARRRAT